MFTGLVQAMGEVRSAELVGPALRLAIDPLSWPHRPAHGASICVNGVCLTHTGTESDQPSRPLLTFDAVAETLARTTLGMLRPGSKVNLEHALRAQDFMGGHTVQGHVDAVGRVEHINPDPGDWRVRFSAPPDAMDCIVPKGSVCIDGVSLTITDTTPGTDTIPSTFGVALIPTTLELTTLASLRVGDPVNIETDMIARTVVEFLRRRSSTAA
ncbi:MAG: riboflavin synthase [Phycisphaerales bacterium]